MWEQSQRSYTNKVTQEKYRMYSNPSTGNLKLMSDAGGEIQAFILSAFHGIIYKFEDGTTETLSAGEFISLKDHSKPTHRKLEGQKRFTKV